VAQQMLDRHPVDERGRMLHSPGLRTGGKFYGFATADDLVVKLPAPRVAELIEAGDGMPCSPRPGRPMREWVCIPAPHEEPCLDYLLEARTFVSTGGGAAYSQ
jgi:hypothetical protein